MFKKILIANRGEIVVRIARTARQLGIHTVGIFSEADEYAEHLKHCDSVYCIGKASSSESYLNINTYMLCVYSVARILTNFWLCKFFDSLLRIHNF